RTEVAIRRRKARLLQGSPHTSRDLVLGQTPARAAERLCHRLEDGEPGVQGVVRVLEDHLYVGAEANVPAHPHVLAVLGRIGELDGPAGGTLEAYEQLARGGLSAARLAHERYDFSGVQVQADA